MSFLVKHYTHYYIGIIRDNIISPLLFNIYINAS